MFLGVPVPSPLLLRVIMSMSMGHDVIFSRSPCRPICIVVLPLTQKSRNPSDQQWFLGHHAAPSVVRPNMTLQGNTRLSRGVCLRLSPSSVIVSFLFCADGMCHELSSVTDVTIQAVVVTWVIFVDIMKQFVGVMSNM